MASGAVGGGVRLSDLEPLSPEVASSENLFEFVFEKRPFSSNAHYSLQVNMCCVQYIILANLIARRSVHLFMMFGCAEKVCSFV